MRDVLIVGAGPSGLVLAFALQQRGIPFRIIDEKSGPSTHSKALGIQARTLELFDKMGIVTPFLEAGVKSEKINYHRKHEQTSLSFKKLPSPYPFVLFLPQAQTEAILLKALEKAGSLVEWKTKLLDVIDGKALVESCDGKRDVLDADWIIGCDGAHSRMRHVLKFPFKGVKFPETFLIADVKAHTSLAPDSPHIFWKKTGFGVVFPLPGAFRLVFPVPNQSQENPSADQLTHLLKLAGCEKPFHIDSIEWISEFQIQRRIVPHLRKGNCFLVGDAAHIHSPIGGQGMNTSIQDAYNLGWKLALACRKVSQASLLDTYEQERHPIAKEVLKQTTRATKLLRIAQKWCPTLFYRLVQLVSMSKKQQQITEQISELAIHYPQSTIIREHHRDKEWEGPKAGERALDVTLEDQSRLFDKLRSPEHTLLLFKAHPEFESAIRQEYGPWIKVCVVEDKNCTKKYAAGPETLYLIRPDGYIGYRSQNFKTEEVIAYLLRIFKPASQRNKL